MNFKLVISFVVMSLFVATNNNAGIPESQLLFSVTSQNKARIGLVNTSGQTLHLEISNKSGDVFLKKTTKGGSNYFELLDLKQMPDGEYIVRVTGMTQELYKKFIVKNGMISIKFENKPIFKVINNEALLVYYYNSENKPVNIVFNHDNELFFKSKAITDTIVNKKFLLNQMPKGQYTIKLFADDEVYNYDLVIK